jgi:hypothetical protein
MTLSMATAAPVLLATNEVASKTRRCCNETLSLSLLPRNSAHRVNLPVEYSALVTHIRNDSVRLGIKSRPVKQSMTGQGINIMVTHT